MEVASIRRGPATQHQAGPHRPEIVCRDTATGTPQRNEAATGFPATASSRSLSGAQRSATSNQAVMST